MRKKSCPLEKEVIESLKTERLEPEIKKHLSECAYCSEVAAVHNWMNQYKMRSWNTEILNKTLPGLESIWNKAHAIRRTERKMVKKAMRPLLFPQTLSYGVFLAGAISLIISNFDKIKTILNSKLIAPTFSIFFMLMAIVLISTLFCAFAATFEKRRKINQ